MLLQLKNQQLEMLIQQLAWNQQYNQVGSLLLFTKIISITINTNLFFVEAFCRNLRISNDHPSATLESNLTDASNNPTPSPATTFTTATQWR